MPPRNNRRGAPTGEFDLIRRFTRLLPLGGEGVRLGVGDDAAVLSPPRGEDLVATVDEVVEGVHFDRRFTPEDVGWKALAVNLSDLAAMGARPLWGLVALGVPRGTPERRLLGVARGLGRCARRHGLAVVGGNVTRAPALAVAITVVGAVPRGRALTRGGARPGDILLASGTFGDAALGLSARPHPALAARQRRPEPRLALGRSLLGLAHAAVDVSDGLVQDLGHLCAASGVAAALEAAEVPLSPAYRARAARLPDPLQPALNGGEDYELLAAVPPGRVEAAFRAAEQAGTRLTVIGRFRRGRGVRILAPDGSLRRPPRGAPGPLAPGHDHLRAPDPALTSPRAGLGSAPGLPAKPRARRRRPESP
jgi:thiamine-monophosphate kinase